MKRLLFLALLSCATLGRAEAQSWSDMFKSLFGGKQETAAEQETAERTALPASIEGNWIYQDPVVVYTGDDMLAALAVAGLQDQFASYYAKAGLTPGEGGFTLRRNGKVRIEMAGQIDGEYRYDSTAGTLSFTGTANGKTVEFDGEVSFESSTMTLLFDARQSLETVQAVSSKAAEDSRMQQISAILKQYPGIKLGAKFRKR